MDILPERTRGSQEEDGYALAADGAGSIVCLS